MNRARLAAAVVAVLVVLGGCRPSGYPLPPTGCKQPPRPQPRTAEVAP